MRILFSSYNKDVENDRHLELDIERSQIAAHFKICTGHLSNNRNITYQISFIQSNLFFFLCIIAKH